MHYSIVLENWFTSFNITIANGCVWGKGLGWIMEERPYLIVHEKCGDVSSFNYQQKPGSDTYASKICINGRLISESHNVS